MASSEWFNRQNFPLPEVQKAIEESEKEIERQKQSRGYGSSQVNSQNQFPFPNSNNEQINNIPEKKYPDKGNVLLIYHDALKSVSSPKDLEDNLGFIIYSNFYVTDMLEYENEEEMRKGILDFNDVINKFKSSTNAGNGEFFIFVSKLVKNVLTQVQVEF